MTLDPAPNSAAPAPAAAAPTDAPQPSVEPPAEARPKRSITLPVLATGGAVVFAVGGVASFLLAGSTQKDAERECPSKPSCDSERTKVRTFDTLALGGFIGAVGLGALAVILWTSGSSSVSVSASSVSFSGAF